MSADITIASPAELNLTGDLADRFARIAKVGAAGPLWATIAAIGAAQTEKRLDGAPAGHAAADGVGPHGETWPAWSSAYAARRGEHHRMLSGDGELRDSITSDSTNSSAVWGYPANIIYAAAQHYGYPARNLPARPSVGFGDDEKTAIIAELSAALSAAITTK